MSRFFARQITLLVTPSQTLRLVAGAASFLVGVATAEFVGRVQLAVWPWPALTFWWSAVGAALLILWQIWPVGAVRQSAGISLFILFGCSYALAFRSVRLPEFSLPAGPLTGRIASFPEIEGRRQTFRLALDGAPAHHVLVTIYREPVYQRDQLLVLAGTVSQPAPGATFDYRRWLEGQGIMGEVRYPDKITVVADPRRFWHHLNTLRSRMLTTYRRLLPEPVASLAAGLALGIDPAVDPHFQDQLRATGLIHMAAVSGQNLSLTVVLVFYWLRRFWLRGAIAAACLVLAIYTILVGAPPSILRADILALALLAGPLLGRPVDPLRALVLAATLLTLANPLALTRDIGFQLSFVVFAGILILGPPLASRLAVWLKGAEETRLTLASCAVASLAVVPIQLGVFGGLSIVSPLANLAVGPLVATGMLGSVLLGLMSFVGPGFAQLVGWVVYLPLALIHALTVFFASFSWSYQTFVAPSWAIAGLAAGLLSLLGWFALGQLPLPARRRDRVVDP